MDTEFTLNITSRDGTTLEQLTVYKYLFLFDYGNAIYRLACKRNTSKAINHSAVWFATNATFKKHTTVYCVPWSNGHLCTLINTHRFTLIDTYYTFWIFPLGKSRGVSCYNFQICSLSSFDRVVLSNCSLSSSLNESTTLLCVNTHTISGGSIQEHKSTHTHTRAHWQTCFHCHLITCSAKHQSSVVVRVSETLNINTAAGQQLCQEKFYMKSCKIM